MEIRYSTNLDGITRDFEVVVDQDGEIHAGIAMPDVTIEQSVRPEVAKAESDSTPHGRSLELVEPWESSRSKLPSQVGDLINAYLVLEDLYQDSGDELGEPMTISEASAFDPHHNPDYPSIDRADECVDKSKWQELSRLKQEAPYALFRERTKERNWMRTKQAPVLEAELKRDEVRNEIVMRNVALVFEVANRQFSYIYGSERKDMIQEAVVGLMRAVEKFDANSRYQFSSYAWKCIEGTMRRFVADRSLFRVPEAAQRKSKEMRSIIEDDSTNFREKADQAYRVGRVSIDQAERIANLGRATEVNLLGDEDQELLDQGVLAPDMVSREAVRANLKNILTEALTANEVYVLLRRFGLDNRLELEDGYGATLEELAKENNTVRERIRQIEMKAIKKLREYVRKNSILEKDVTSA